MPRLPQLVVALLLAALAAHFTLGIRWPLHPTAAREQTAAESGPQGRSAATVPPLAEAEPLLEKAIKAMNGYPSVAAKIRLQGMLFDQPMTGTGRYLHARGADGWPLSRLEVKLQVDDYVVSWQQVGDGTDLWTYTKLENSRLRRINVARVRAAVQNDPDVPLWTLRRVAGGLGQLLDSLQQAFLFDKASPGNYRGVPVWLLHGRLRQGLLLSLLPQQANSIKQGNPPDFSELPEQAPDHVLLYLGKSDLLPYRIDYRRGRGDEARSLVTLELHHVRSGAVDPSLFSYHPDGRKFDDGTRAFLDATRAARQ